MKKFIFLILAVFTLSFADENPKAVINLTTPDLKRFEIYLLGAIANSAEYYKSQLKELHVVVVIHGDAYRFFIKDLKNSPYKDDTKLIEKQKEIETRLINLVNTYGVKFIMCKEGMMGRKIDPKNIYPFVEFVENGFIALVDWQNRGYAYIPLH